MKAKDKRARIDDIALLGDMTSATDTADRFDALLTCARQAGFDDVSYLSGLVIEDPTGASARYVQRIQHISSCPGDWLDALMGAAEAEQDYDVQRMLIGHTSPFVSGHHITALMGPLSLGQRDILARKADAGFAANFIVPLPTVPYARTCYAAFMFISKMDEVTFSRSMARWSHWLTASAHLFHHQIGGDASSFLEREINVVTAVADYHDKGSASQADQLTPRQRDVLGRLANGERLADIAATLSISSVTVDRHAKAVRDKLNAKTNAEAVAKAVSLGLIVA